MDGPGAITALLGLLLQWGWLVTSDPQHYCYTELVRALAVSCDRIYAAEPTGNSRRGRRSTESGTEFIRRRLPRNVVEQCCKNPCNVGTLQRYCSIVREGRRNSGSGVNGTSTEGQVTGNRESSSTDGARGQGSTTPSSGLSSFQRLTEPPLPEPVPVGDFENHFYGQ